MLAVTSSNCLALQGLDFMKVTKVLSHRLNKWSWVKWRWIMFFSQVFISVLTLGFCFYMIAKYQDKSQKAYWPIVTIIVGCKLCAPLLSNAAATDFFVVHQDTAGVVHHAEYHVPLSWHTACTAATRLVAPALGLQPAPMLCQSMLP
jgi:hypothetical protein